MVCLEIPVTKHFQKGLIMKKLMKEVALLQVKVATQDLLIAELVAHHANNIGLVREDLEYKYNVMIEVFMNQITKEDDETIALRDEAVDGIKNSLGLALNQYDDLRVK